MPDMFDKLADEAMAYVTHADDFHEEGYAAYLRTEIAKTHVPRARVEAAIENAADAAPTSAGFELKQLLEDK